MTSEMQAYTTKDGGLWVFPEGPNRAPAYIGCTDADDVSAPQGDIELIRCFGPDGKYQVVGTKSTPPDPITTTLTSLTFRTRSLLERIRCEYGLMFLQRDGGRADLFCNHQRYLILADVRNTEKTYGGLVKREEDAESTRGFSLSAQPPLIDGAEITGKRIATTETMSFTDVFMLKEDCTLLPVKYGVAVALDSGLYGAGDVWLTADGGQTWTVTTGTPNLHDLQACAMVDLCHGVRRIIVADKAVGASVGGIAYSDDDGATWIHVSLIAGQVGYGVTHGGGIFALDANHIWLASAKGYIFFSADGGETWSVQDADTLGVGDYTQIEFTSDGLHGYAGAGAGLVAKTVDGGTNWDLATVIAGTPDVLAVALIPGHEDILWVGTASGTLFFTEDAGVTWTQRTGWVGSGIGDVHDIGFANDYVGFMIADDATPEGSVYQTIDGGYSWDKLTTEANSGLTALAVGDENYLVYVGLTNAGTGFIGVVEE